MVLVQRRDSFRKILTLETKAAPFILLLPLLITLLTVTVFPTVFAFSVSLMNYKLDSPVHVFQGFANYVRILSDLRFWNGMKNTLVFSASAIVLEISLGMVLASLLNQKIHGRSFLRTAMLIPMISTPVVISLLWILFLNPQYGLVNYLFSLVRLPLQVWLATPSQALWALVLIDVWEWTPFAILVLMSGMQSISEELYEAAQIDSANQFQTFMHITLPSLRPFILVVAVFRFMDSFKWFDTFAVVTKGGPGISTENWSFYAYSVAFEFFDMGYSAALGVIMLIVVTAISQMLLKRVFQTATWD